MDYAFRNLVFEGGGVKGIAYGGALEVLQQKNMLSGIQRVAGTSAGAITATLLSIGYSATEVGNIIAKTNFKSFEDDSWGFFRDSWNLLNKYGWYKGDSFREWLRNLIQAKTGTPDLLFRELRQQGPAKGYKELFVVATNLSLQRAEIFSPEHTPDLRICDAARMSMSIPLYFHAVINGKKEVIVDGGVSWNYAINLFDNKKYLHNPANGLKVDYADNPDYVFNYETLGFRLDSKDVIEYSKHNWGTPPEKITGIKEYAGALINFMMEMANKSHLHGNDWNRTVFVDTLDVKTTEFNLPSEKVTGLVASGKKCAEEYFTWRDSDPVCKNFPLKTAIAADVA